MEKSDLNETGAQRLNIRKATCEDLPAMSAIFAAARRFMAENGNPTQWGDSSPKMGLVEADIERGDSYVITDGNGTIVATFALMTPPDPHYSEITDGPGWIDSTIPYMTLHRVASDGSAKGIMPMIFEWASAKSAHLRIDTHADNAIMLRHIRRAGFSFRGIVRMDDGSPRRAFQRITGHSPSDDSEK